MSSGRLGFCEAESSERRKFARVWAVVSLSRWKMGDQSDRVSGTSAGQRAHTDVTSDLSAEERLRAARGRITGTGTFKGTDIEYQIRAAGATHLARFGVRPFSICGERSVGTLVRAGGVDELAVTSLCNRAPEACRYRLERAPRR